MPQGSGPKIFPAHRTPPPGDVIDKWQLYEDTRSRIEYRHTGGTERQSGKERTKGNTRHNRTGKDPGLPACLAGEQPRGRSEERTGQGRHGKTRQEYYWSCPSSAKY